MVFKEMDFCGWVCINYEDISLSRSIIRVNKFFLLVQCSPKVKTFSLFIRKSNYFVSHFLLDFLEIDFGWVGHSTKYDFLNLVQSCSYQFIQKVHQIINKSYFQFESYLIFVFLWISLNVYILNKINEKMLLIINWVLNKI